MSSRVRPARKKGPSAEAWNAHKNIIIQLYEADSNTQEDVQTCMERDYGFSATQYKCKLKEWGIRKNVNRHLVFAALRQQEETPGFKLPEGVKSYIKRNKIVYARKSFAPQKSQLTSTISLTSLEKAVSNMQFYVASSCASRVWQSYDPDSLLMSSAAQERERDAVHGFISAIEIGCHESRSGNREAAHLYWRGAHQKVKLLIQGTYHDNLPNIVQKLNDLVGDGFGELAVSLKTYIVGTATQQGCDNEHKRSLLENMGVLDFQDLAVLEKEMIRCCIDAFEKDFGTESYSACVMRNNQSRRRLRHDVTPNASFIQAHMRDNLPSLESSYGPCNKRTLDSITSCIELVYKRLAPLQTQQDQHQLASQPLTQVLLDYANMLIARAQNTNEAWARLYFLIHGHYYHGTISHQLQNHSATKDSFNTCIELINEFSTIEPTPIFDPERLRICEILEGLAMDALLLSTFSPGLLDVDHWQTDVDVDVELGPMLDYHGLDEHEAEVQRWRHEREMTLRRMRDHDVLLLSSVTD